MANYSKIKVLTFFPELILYRTLLREDFHYISKSCCKCFDFKTRRM